MEGYKENELYPVTWNVLILFRAGELNGWKT
jgi:hypothetical protein